jgi:MFS family permease
MLFTKNKTQKSKIFYGWYILAASFIILFINSGATFSIGVMFKPMIMELGWSRSLFSSAFLLNMTVYALSLIVAGHAYDRYGPKWVIIISSLLLSGGFVAIYFIETFWQYMFFYGVISAAGLGGTTAPLFAAILSKWFEKNRGLCISLALAGNGIGQFIMVPLFTKIVITSGWRISFLLIGIMTLFVNIILAMTVIKSDPSDMGLQALGTVDTDPIEKNTDKTVQNKGMGLFAAMKTMQFWYFAIVMFVCGGGDFLVSIHLIPMVTDQGISATTAGNMLAWFGLMSLLGVIVAGPLADKIGTKIPITITFSLRVLLFLIILNSQSVFSYYLFALGFGFTLLITAPLAPILVGRLFGYSKVGLISGFITTIHHLSGGLCAYTGGLVFDVTGSYKVMLIISVIMALAAVISSLFIHEVAIKSKVSDPLVPIKQNS